MSVSLRSLYRAFLFSFALSIAAVTRFPCGCRLSVWYSDVRRRYDDKRNTFFLSFLYRASFQHVKWKTNRYHYFSFIHISTGLYMFLHVDIWIKLK
jgi:hypothetical protein